MKTLQPDRTAVHGFYDGDALAYDNLRWRSAAGARNNDVQLAIVRDLLGRVDGLAADLGSGTGRFSQVLAAYAPAVLLVDAAPQMLRTAHDRVPAARPIRADLTCLPIPDRTAKVVTCLNVLSHVPDWRRALQEIGRILAPDGYVVLNFNNASSLYWLPALIVNRRRRAFRADVFSRWTHWSAFSSGLADAGLSIVDARGHLPAPSWLPPPLARVASTVDATIRSRPRLAPLPFLRLVKAG